MSRAAFRQADIQRVIRAFASEGLPTPALRIERTGEIHILPTAAAEASGDDLGAAIRATVRDGED